MIQTENHGKVSLSGIRANVLTADSQISRTQTELAQLNAELPDLATALDLATANLIEPNGAVNDAQAVLDNAETDEAQTALDEANAILAPFQSAYDEANNNYNSKLGEITGSESRLTGYQTSKTLWESYLG